VPVLNMKKKIQGMLHLFYCWYDNFSCAISPKMKVFPLVLRKNRYRSASLTTEAAMVFPVFFFGIYMIWQLFLLMLFQMSVCREITDTAMNYAHLGYAERKAQEQEVDISWLYQPLLWNALPESERVENLLVLCLPEEDGAVRVEVGYQFCCEAAFFTTLKLPVQQSFRFYPYVGVTDEDLFATEEAKDIVYMTEYGTVYHESRACSYLNVVVRSVDASQIENERNSAGRRYSLCDRCDNQEVSELVYVSKSGTKYHLVASCPALKRTVLEKERKETEGVPACHRCGKKKEVSENE